MLTDGVEFEEIEPRYVSEELMLADPMTKYTTLNVWRRHMLRILNVDEL